MQKKAKRSAKLKRAFLGAVTGLFITSAISADQKMINNTIQNDNLIKAFKEGRAKTFGEYIEMTDYFTSDTLHIDKHNARNRICLGQYLPEKNKVEIKYFITDHGLNVLMILTSNNTSTALKPTNSAIRHSTLKTLNQLRFTKKSTTPPPKFPNKILMETNL